MKELSKTIANMITKDLSKWDGFNYWWRTRFLLTKDTIHDTLGDTIHREVEKYLTEQASLADKINTELNTLADEAQKENTMQTLDSQTTLTYFTVETALSILTLLEDWVINERRQFTCFDVTRQLRNNGVGVRHSDVRKFVHSLNKDDSGPFLAGTYERATTTFMTSSGDFDTAEVYSHYSDNDDYNPDQVQNVTSVVMKVDGPSIIPSVTKPAYTQPKSDKKFGVDNRGRICVRNSLTRDMNISPGDVVYVSGDTNGLTISKIKPTDDSQIGNLKVDKSGNVRVTRHLQSKAGIHADRFAMAVSADEVSLTF